MIIFFIKKVIITWPRYTLKKIVSAIALIDISTGEFLTAQGNSDYIDKLLQSFTPSEIIYPKSRQADFKEHYGDRFSPTPLRMAL